MSQQDRASAVWHKSSYSAGANNCVEVAEGRVTSVRDSMNRHLDALFFTSAEWRSFLSGVKNDEL
ncbi:DUF397 domain-containing protein [Nocardiopsis gilva YIM 90087]|uniref:DUF397 domain-containing protein n=1 Tax=Nocardiopsis gilva YIM 90087 TaxID=1235441 RepID=A0A223SCH8_9ACTN|nr:DUF397 domain-containing protein [Nocardiopsis gilva]ASU85810.1 DUF397 domain-containing protein [Nocardiopsis gilva YIM 90087]